MRKLYKTYDGTCSAAYIADDVDSVHLSAVHTRALSRRQPVLQHFDDCESSTFVQRRMPHAAHSSDASKYVAAPPWRGSAPSVKRAAVRGWSCLEPVIQQFPQQTDAHPLVSLQQRMPARELSNAQRGSFCRPTSGRLSVGHPSYCQRLSPAT
mmetsp:Transcript_60558/g.100519  ORF Transcript_60558/g.100519 Transcript_60558/m.100519 type:complete len:153 (-) Transcript_60558:21-479(-)